MSKRVTIIIAVSGLCLVGFVVGWLLPLYWLGEAIGRGYRQRSYEQRHIECASEALLPVLETTFDINFPDDFREIKTAKSRPIEGHIEFLVKFAAAPDAVDGFLKSFQENRLCKVELSPYDAKLDRRKCQRWPPPEWFTKPISHGKQGNYYPGFGIIEFSIDMTDKTNFVVYLYGFY